MRRLGNYRLGIMWDRGYFLQFIDISDINTGNWGSLFTISLV